jgi:hypothetical protein
VPDLPPQGFRVDRVPEVNRQVRALGEEAARRGLRAEYLAALRRIVQRLQTDPVEWGEPEYHTALPGGLVCRGVVDPVCVQYAIYAEERAVLILNLSLLGGATSNPNN